MRGGRYTAMHVMCSIGAGNQHARRPLQYQCCDRDRVRRPRAQIPASARPGLKTLATWPEAREIENPAVLPREPRKPRHRPTSERTPQRLGPIHAKIANRRSDFSHKESTKIVKEYPLVVVSNASSSKRAETAKSVRDAVGWACGIRWRTGNQYGDMGLEVNAAYTFRMRGMRKHCGTGRPSGSE